MASPHVLVFPFMTKSHTIPVMQLVRHLLRHGATITIVTTLANRPFVTSFLPSSSASIVVVNIPFPQNIPGIPPGVESMDKLPDISFWPSFAAATKLMQPEFEQILASLHVDFMITDDFFSWTTESAEKHGVPRFVYYAVGTFPLLLMIAVARGHYVVEKDGDFDLLKFLDFPWIKIRKDEIDPVFVDPGFVGTLYYEFVFENIEASSRSQGILMNTFYEFESAYVDVWNGVFGPKIWCVGPVSLPEDRLVNPEDYDQKPAWIHWLDQKHARTERVLYVAFGTQVEVTVEQFEEIQIGLERSGVNFLWCVGKNVSQLENGFEARVRGRGLVVRDWVDQREILAHDSVQGFFSHCGWNAVIESVSASVPILALPMMWEQPLSARLVVEELGVGLRLETCVGGRFAKWESVAKAAKELMEGEGCVEVRKKVAEVGSAAVGAVKEGGSSWRSLDQLITKFRERRSTE